MYGQICDTTVEALSTGGGPQTRLCDTGLCEIHAPRLFSSTAPGWQRMTSPMHVAIKILQLVIARRRDRQRTFRRAAEHARVAQTVSEGESMNERSV